MGHGFNLCYRRGDTDVLMYAAVSAHIRTSIRGTSAPIRTPEDLRHHRADLVRQAPRVSCHEARAWRRVLHRRTARHHAGPSMPQQIMRRLLMGRGVVLSSHDSSSSGELIRYEGCQAGGCRVVEGERGRRVHSECRGHRAAEVDRAQGVEAGLCTNVTQVC